MSLMDLSEHDYQTCFLYASRDPTENDVNHSYTVWVSTEYTPNRVFVGQKGKWKFIGKFQPCKE